MWWPHLNKGIPVRVGGRYPSRHAESWSVLVIEELHQLRTVDRRIEFHRGRDGVQPAVITCGCHSAVRATSRSPVEFCLIVRLCLKPNHTAIRGSRMSTSVLGHRDHAAVRSSFVPIAIRGHRDHAAIRSSFVPIAIRGHRDHAAVRSSFVPIAIRGSRKPASHRKPTYRCSCAPGLVGGIWGDELEPCPRAISSPAPPCGRSSSVPASAGSSPAPSCGRSSPVPSSAGSSPVPSSADSSQVLSSTPAGSVQHSRDPAGSVQHSSAPAGSVQLTRAPLRISATRAPPRVSTTGHGAAIGVCCAHPNRRISLTSTGSVQFSAFRAPPRFCTSRAPPRVCASQAPLRVSASRAPLESWSRPTLLRLRWPRPARLRLHWPHPARLRLRGPRLAHLRPRWPRPAHLRLRWLRPVQRFPSAPEILRFLSSLKSLRFSSAPKNPHFQSAPRPAIPPKKIFLGGPYTRGPGSHNGHGWDIGQGHYGSSV